jgi:hypothetical protein
MRGRLRSLGVFGYVAVALALGPAPARALERGDLIVAVGNSSALALIDHRTGFLAWLEPPPGEDSVLVDPGAVTVGSDQILYVADRATRRLVAIDPETGEQHVLGRTVISPFGGGFEPVDTGALPQGIAAADGILGPQLTWVADDGLYAAGAGFLGWSGSLGIPASGYEMLDVALDLGLLTVDRTWIAGGHAGLLYLDAGSTEPQVKFGVFSEIEVVGVAVSSGAEPMVYFVSNGSLPAESNCFTSGALYRVDPAGGILLHSLNGQLDGLDLECLSEIAVAPGVLPRVYLVDHLFNDRTGRPRLFEVTLIEGRPRVERLVAEYPGDALAFRDIAVFVPEPVGGALAAALTLAACRRSRRRCA